LNIHVWLNDIGVPVIDAMELQSAKLAIQMQTCFCPPVPTYSSEPHGQGASLPPALSPPALLQHSQPWGWCSPPHQLQLGMGFRSISK